VHSNYKLHSSSWPHNDSANEPRPAQRRSVHGSMYVTDRRPTTTHLSHTVSQMCLAFNQAKQFPDASGLMGGLWLCLLHRRSVDQSGSQLKNTCLNRRAKCLSPCKLLSASCVSPDANHRCGCKVYACLHQGSSNCQRKTLPAHATGKSKLAAAVHDTAQCQWVSAVQ
jgi:hypothetical protein